MVGGWVGEMESQMGRVGIWEWMNRGVGYYMEVVVNAQMARIERQGLVARW